MEPDTKASIAFATWFTEMVSLVRELEARRQFDSEFIEWLRETDRTKDFEVWRKAKKAGDEGEG